MHILLEALQGLLVTQIETVCPLRHWETSKQIRLSGRRRSGRSSVDKAIQNDDLVDIAAAKHRFDTILKQRRMRRVVNRQFIAQEKQRIAYAISGGINTVAS